MAEIRHSCSQQSELQRALLVMPVDMWLLYSKPIKASYVRDRSFKFITDTSFPCCSFTTALNAQLNAALKGFNMVAGAGVNQAAVFLFCIVVTNSDIQVWQHKR